MIPQIFSNTCPLNSGHANYSIPIGQNIIFDCCLLVACCLLLMALFNLWQSNLNLEIAEKGPFWTISIDISQFDWCFSIKIVYKSWLRTSTRFERVKKILWNNESGRQLNPFNSRTVYLGNKTWQTDWVWWVENVIDLKLKLQMFGIGL